MTPDRGRFFRSPLPGLLLSGLCLLVIGLSAAWLPAEPVRAAKPSRLLEDFDRSRGIIETTRNVCLLLELYLADTPEQQARGLMYVEQLDENEGMLFRHSRSALINMWMKNTLISLDMLFIRTDGSIASIARKTTPLSTERISSLETVRAVLEMNAGFADRWGIEPGSRILAIN
jgi:uncharacterized membrane protein (UPF0127 family)